MNPTDPEAIFAAWAEQADRGEAPDFAVIIASHPQLAATLQAMHRDWQLFAPILERVVPGLIASDAGAARDAPFLFADDTAAENLPSPELIERLGVTLPDAGRYGFRGVLGRGGGGVVLRVWDHKLRRSLAMKVVLGRGEHDPATGTPPVDAAVMTRFVDEARIASQLDHPGIVPVHELGTDATGRAFFTMRLVKGDDLSKVFAKVRDGIDGWTQVRALGVLAKVCDAVAYAHGKGVVHRDLKPANVMVGRHGEVHVMDWGLARVHEALRAAEMPRATDSHVQTLRAAERGETPDSPLLTAAGSVLGTPVYMAPEQARGDLDRVGPHSDVYAIGAMLYELLAGSPPFMPRDANVDPRTVVLRVLEGPPQPLMRLAPRAPLELVAICERAMAREPGARYADVLALGHDLAAFLERRVVSAYEAGTWAETKKWVRRNPGLAAATAATITVLAAAVVLVSSTNSRQQRFLTDASWSAMSQADRLLRTGDDGESTAHCEEGLLQLAQAVALDPDNESAKARLLFEATHRGHRWGALRAPALFANSSEVTAGPASPDGRWILAEGDGVTAAIVDSRTGRVLYSLGAQEAWTKTFSPDGQMVLVQSEKNASLWDAVSGSLIHRFEHVDLHSMAFSADGTLVATVSPSTTRVWSVASGDLMHSLNHDFEVDSCRFCDEGLHVFAYDQSEGVEVWRLADTQLLTRIPCDSFDIGPPESSTMVVTGPRYAAARLVNFRTGNVQATLSSDEDVLTAAFNNGGDRVLVSCRTVSTLCDAQLTPLDTLAGTGVFSPDGATLALKTGRETRIHSATTGDVVATVPGTPDDFEFSPDCLRLIGRTGERRHVWDATTGRLLRAFDSVAAPQSHQFLPDGRIVLTFEDDTAGCVTTEEQDPRRAFVSAEPLLWSSFDQTGSRLMTVGRDIGVLFEIPTGRRLETFRAPDPIHSAWFSRRGLRLLTGTGHRATYARGIDDRDHCFDTAALRDAGGKVLADLSDSRGRVRVRVWPTGPLMLVHCMSAGRARLLDVETGDVLREFEHDGWIFDAHTSSDGRLAVRREEAEWTVHDVADGTPSSSWPVAKASSPDKQYYVRDHAMSPNGRFVMTADGPDPPTLEVRDPRDGRVATRIPAAEGGVFVPGKPQALIYRSNNQVELWDLELGEFVRPVDGVGFWPEAQAFSSNGRLYASFDTQSHELTVVDLTTGRPLIRSRLVDSFVSMAFDPNDRYLKLREGSHLRAIDLSLLSDAATSTLDGDTAIALAQWLTGHELSAHGRVTQVAASRHAANRQHLDEVARSNTRLATLIGWLTASGPDAPAWPGSNLTRRELADHMLSEGDALWAHRAYLTDPSHPLVHIALAGHPGIAAVGGNAYADRMKAEAETFAIRREHLREFGLSRLPEDADICARAAEMLLQQSDKPRALAAAEAALALAPDHASALRLKADALK